MKKITRLLIPALCGAATLIGINANAFQDYSDGCYAAEVLSFEQGQRSNGEDVPLDRSDDEKGLGMPDASNAAGGFVSLGFGGSITLQMGGAVLNQAGNDLMIFETSFSGDECGASDDESAMVEVSQFGVNWYNVGEICRDGGVDIASAPVLFITQVRITDITTGSGDGWDLDGIMAVNGCFDMQDPDFCYGAGPVVSFDQGLTKDGGAVDANRSDETQALGMPDLFYDPATPEDIRFVSLGYGGSIIIGFDGVVMNEPGDDILVPEITGPGALASDAWVEMAEVSVSADNFTYYPIGTVNKGEVGSFDISDAAAELSLIRYVKVQDMSPAESSSEDAFDLDGIIAVNGCSEDPFQEPEECLNFDVYYSDIPLGSGPTSIYKVNFAPGGAELSLVREFDGNANYHIAYDDNANVIYAVNENGLGFETVDPILGTSTYTAFPQSTQKTTTAVYYQGKLIIGSSQLNEIYSYDLLSGTLTQIAEAEVQGGDLVVVDEQLFLATQNGGGNWYKISDEMAHFVQATPGQGQVNGSALLGDGGIIFSNKGESVFQVLNTDMSVSEIPVFLNGDAFTLRWGDMASGCNLQNNEEPCSPALVNGDFEELAEGYTISGGWDYVPQDQVPGWSANEQNGTIEIQKSGQVDGNDSFSGSLHFELNGDGLNTLYQEICSEPGTKIKISFAHKMRRDGGDDRLHLFVDGSLAGIEGTTFAPYMAPLNGDWEVQEFVYEVPEGQFSTFIYFKAIDGSNNTVGNLMDDIMVELTTDAVTNIDDLNATLSNQQQAFNSTAQIDMYPVPASDRLNVKLSTQASMTVSYEIVSVMGQSFNRGSVDANVGQTHITADISNLAEGTYFFVMNMNGTTVTRQFVKAGR